MSHLTLPKIEDISDFLSMLYGLTVTATQCDALAPASRYVVANYIDDQGTPVAAIAADIAAAAKLSAALTQIPAGGVEDTIKEGELSPVLQDNLSEVFNILVNLFPTDDGTRLSFADVSFDKNPVPAFEESISIAIDIQRYSKGNIELFF
jgi:hypothetical protein